MRGLFNTIRDLYQSRKLLFSLAKNDFRMKFAGSYFGLIWSIIQPLVSIVVFVFVFQVGFRSSAVKDVPFAFWLSVGMITWFYFSEAFSSATNSFFEYSYLVKKVVFKVSIIPIIKIVSSCFVHLIFIVIVTLLGMLFNYMPNIYYLQLIYYCFALSALIFSISLITSSVAPFFKDLNQVVGTFLQFGMWITPIMWQDTMIPEQFRWILKLNPMSYIVEGYRESMIYRVPLWARYNQAMYFWIATLILFFIGLICFKKLRPHFADVL